MKKVKVAFALALVLVVLVVVVWGDDLLGSATSATATPIATPTPVTNTYPALTMADVAPWIAKMGANGHPGHDVAGNTQCAYWLDPKFIAFGDDTGPNTSGVEQSGVFRFDLAAIARYKNLPEGAVFVIEASWATYKGVEYEQAFLITSERDTVDASGAAIFALPNPKSVDPFVALRQAHLLCRGYEDSIVDFRSGSPVVKYTARSVSALIAPTSASTAVAPATTKAPTATPAKVNPSVVDTGIDATYSFGTLTGTVDKAVCVELKGASGTLAVNLTKGGFATSGRVDASTDWLLAKSSGVGKYATSWSGWLICFDANADQAVASLIATDGNAKGNARVTWQPAK